MNAQIFEATHLQEVEVSSPARLHLGFLDLNGGLGRKFGSFGLTIDSHNTTVQIKRAQSLQIDTPSAAITEKVITITDTFFNNVGANLNRNQLSINVTELIPSHSGFGSGTQLNLAIGTALARFYSLDITTQDLAKALGRGQRSGIGIASFDHGGFIVDGGNKPGTNNPPMLFHHDFPTEWRVVLIIDKANHGIHGQSELNAFKTLPVFPQTDAARICHLTLMQLLPSLIEKDINNFGEAVTTIQGILGDHFAPAQGGGRYTSKEVESLLLEANNLGFNGIAQSSWGPTGCIFVESAEKAQQLALHLNHKIKKSALDQYSLDILVAKANNTGAIIKHTQ